MNNPDSRVLLNEKYAGDGLDDVERDVCEAFNDNYNPEIVGIPKDEHGFHAGTFTVTITWVPEEV